MDISARSFLTTGVSLTAATAIAFTPLAIASNHHKVPVPAITVADLRLAVSADDIRAFIVDLQEVLDDATTTVAAAAGIPGQTLIGVVDNIVTTINTVFTGLVDATDNQTIEALLTVLQTFSADAFEMLAENLGRINPVIITTTAQVGELLTSALTGSLHNILTAVVNVVNDPLSAANYAGLVTAGLASGQLLTDNGLEAVQSLGDAAFDIAEISLDEFTFQFNNFAVNGIGAVLTVLGDASNNAVLEAVLDAVHALAIAPAIAVFNLGSGVLNTALTTAQAGFDVLFDGPTGIVTSTGNPAQSALTAGAVESVENRPASAPEDDEVIDEAPTDSAPTDSAPTDSALETDAPITDAPIDEAVAEEETVTDEVDPATDEVPADEDLPRPTAAAEPAKTIEADADADSAVSDTAASQAQP